MATKTDFDEFVERRIITGLCISDDYVRKVKSFWKDDLLENPEFRRISRWCFDYFDQYDKVPDSNIESIFLENLKFGKLGKAESSYIELALKRISDDFERGEQFNSAYLYDQTIKYFKDRHLGKHREKVDRLRLSGQIDEAEQVEREFQAFQMAVTRGLELGGEEAAERIRQAFKLTSQPVLKYPGALGQMWNDHLTRGSFIAILAPEKRGKSLILLDMGLRAIRQKSNVAFFQAGDMTEAQQLRRLCIYLAGRSDNPRYCVEHWHPVGDCILNQINKCNRKDRNCSFGVFDVDEEAYRNGITKYQSKKELVERIENEKNEDYQPCESMTCRNRLGAVWLEKEKSKNPLNGEQAARISEHFFKKWHRRFKLVTYGNGELNLTEILACLDEWEHNDDFVADVVLVDYADLLDAPVSEFRHRQDAIWKGLRRISQIKHCLVATATQADAQSYAKDRLNLSNFSEDKRKYAHVTAMWGLNQDVKGREKELGIMRINEMVVRDGEFNPRNECYVMQDLWMGRPFLSSFFSTYWDKPRVRIEHHDLAEQAV